MSDRFKLETIGMPPELAARARAGPRARSCRAGSRRSRTSAVWVANIRMKAEGTVDTQWDGRDRVRFTPTPEDMQSVRKALTIDRAPAARRGGARGVAGRLPGCRR